MYKILSKENVDHLSEPLFIGNGTSIARYDVNKYPYFNKLTETQLSFFWRPEEVDVSVDMYHFQNKLSPSEQHIFVSNLKRQTLLDTIQGRAPATILMPLTTLPELEVWLANWGSNETVHSLSYTYIIKNCFSEPDKIFDGILDIEEIKDCANDITRYGDELYEYSSLYQVFGFNKVKVEIDGKVKKYNITKRELKKRILKYIISVNVLEGVRFYVSFACSWAFAERKLMEGNAKIIKLICRDENNHLASTQKLINLMINDEDYSDIFEEIKDEIYDMYIRAGDSEKKWGAYLFQDGSMLGLNQKLLNNFIEWIINQRLSAINLKPIYDVNSNPLPWIMKWIGNNDEGSSVQVAPQETEKTEYLIGAIDNDYDESLYQDIEFDLET